MTVAAKRAAIQLVGYGRIVQGRVTMAHGVQSLH
jgi:hypothetical protein